MPAWLTMAIVLVSLSRTRCSQPSGPTPNHPAGRRGSNYGRLWATK